MPIFLELERQEDWEFDVIFSYILSLMPQHRQDPVPTCPQTPKFLSGSIPIFGHHKKMSYVMCKVITGTLVSQSREISRHTYSTEPINLNPHLRLKLAENANGNHVIVAMKVNHPTDVNHILNADQEHQGSIYR